MSETKKDNEILGIIITKNKIANMNIEYIHVSEEAVEPILKNVQLVQSAQQEAVDKMIDRTPNYFELDSQEQVAKIKMVLTTETIVEYLRLHGYIKKDVDMLEIGINEEGTTIVSAFYFEKGELENKVFKDQMSEEQVEELERQYNALDGTVNIYEEAKKRIEKMKEDNVLPFQNRAARRQAKNNKKVRLSHK